MRTRTMPATAAPTEPVTAVDLSERTDPPQLPEWMDEPCTYEEFRECVRDLGKLNRWTLGYRPTLRFLAEAVERAGAVRGGLAIPERPLRVLDVGSGGGDGLRRIARWAARRRLPVQLTGIDLNPHAARAARELSGKDPCSGGIRWMTGDALTEPGVQTCDLVLSSLVTHHMEDAEIVRFLRWMEAAAPVGWFVNDLLRSERAYRIFPVLAGAMRWHPFVRHDGLVSIRRGFREADWRRLLGEAGVPLSAVRFAQSAPGRLCLARLR